MFTNIGAVGQASSYAGGGGIGSNQNPYGPVGPVPTPGHFRRHGNAEQGYGGSMGLTPPGTPPRSRQSSPRSASRRRRMDDDEPPARREQPRRERSREREDTADNAAPTTSMPTEWGARTLRLEKQIQDSAGEIVRLTALIGQLQTTVEGMHQRANSDHNRLNAIEGAIPERVHRCEERQAYHVEILNGFARNATEQISSLQHRMNMVEEHQQVPNFGGGNSSGNAQNFNIGSPISEPFQTAPPAAASQTPPSAPTFDPWANHRPNQTSAHGTTPQTPPAPTPDPWANSRPTQNQNSARTFAAREWNLSDKKVSKALTLFDGHAQNYRNWSDRMKDHCKEVNSGYGKHFQQIENSKTRIYNRDLGMGNLGNGTIVDSQWLSQHLWVFIGNHISNDLHGRRLSLTQNDQDNGFELWRSLFIENEGGAEQVALGGMSSLHAFPQCQRLEDLQHWLGQWQICRHKYGSDLPETHLKQMFLNMLPTSVSEKLRERRDLTTLQQYINEIDADLGRLNDARLAKLHAQRMSSALKAGSRSSVNAVVEEQPPPTPQPTVSEDIGKKLDTLISVLSSNGSQQRGRTSGPADRTSKREDRSASPHRSKSPRGIDPAWEKEGKGCLHCGARGHQRKNCMKFKKLLTDNNNSLPTGYKGAYEKWKDQRKKVNVSAIPDFDLDDDLDEFPETNMVWCLPTKKSNLRSLSVPIAPVKNCFSALQESDDEDEILSALQQLTPNIRIGPKVPQKHHKISSALSKKEIANIARQVADGTIDLPDLDLDSNQDYKAVWALVDSGAGKSCADKSKHFPHVRTKNKPSSARMATASGQELKSRGTFKVKGLTAEGQQVMPNFEDTDVDMPIIAVNDISQEDTEVIFRKGTSEMVDVRSGRRSRFAKQRGVYFMKMYYEKNQCTCGDEVESGFTRPGTP